MKKVIYIIRTCQNCNDYVNDIGFIQAEHCMEVHDEFRRECEQIVYGSVGIVGRCDISEDLSFLKDILVNERKKTPNTGIDVSYMRNIILKELRKRNIEIDTSATF